MIGIRPLRMSYSATAGLGSKTVRKTRPGGRMKSTMNFNERSMRKVRRLSRYLAPTWPRWRAYPLSAAVQTMAGWEPILFKSRLRVSQALAGEISGDWRLRCVAYCRGR